MARRQIRKLSPGERATAQWMLADGYDAGAVARKLGVDVRSLNGLLDSPVHRQLSDLDRIQLVFRNAWIQYERSRDLAENLRRAIPEQLTPEDGRGQRVAECVRQHQLAADRHLKTALEAAAQIKALGGGNAIAGRVVEIPVPGRPELGDLADDRNGEDAADDADQ